MMRAREWAKTDGWVHFFSFANAVGRRLAAKTSSHHERVGEHRERLDEDERGWRGDERGVPGDRAG